MKQLPPEEVESLEEEILLCDKAIEKAQERKDLQKLLEFNEKSLFLRKKIFAPNSPEVHDAICSLVEACNYVATAMLQLNNTQVVFDLLKRALDVNHLSNIQKAITFNNLACYYRRVGKLRIALTYLEKAYQLESSFPNADVSQTHLNLCATLSQLGRHEQALHHAQTAVIKVYQFLCPLLVQQEPKEEPSTAVRERVSVLCIAYFNKGVEHEHLKVLPEAIASYTEGAKWARTYLGDGHQITKILDHSLAALQQGGTAGRFFANRTGEPLDPGLEQLMTPREHKPRKSKEPACITSHKQVYDEQQRTKRLLQKEQEELQKQQEEELYEGDEFEEASP
ncbi:unnamed protein product [Amoebophrya sp. A120]|nr:unnamed protein product [Amoebophrya sp. A120]|eukprot:GSA120T00007887001.1